jgi:putative MATE family efflux protein
VEAAAQSATGRARVVLDEHHLTRSVNRMATPIIAENLFQTLLGVVDMLMVAKLGAAALAGVGTALQIMFLAIAALSAVSVGTTVLVARASGAGRPEEAAGVIKQSLLLGMALAVLVSVVGHQLADRAIAVIGASAEVVRTGGDYLDVVAMTSLFLVIQLVCAGALRGVGDTRTPMVVTGLVNIINVAAAYCLIFGHFGLPALGVTGSALAASLARAVGAVALLGVLFKGGRWVQLPLSGDWRPRWRTMRRIVAIGLPSMIEQTLISAGMLMYSALAVTLGTTIYAAQRITFNAISISFLPGLGYGLAATTMTGQALGAGRPDLARRSTWIAAALAATWMGTMGLLLILFGQPVMRLFSQDPTIVSVGAAALAVLAFSQPFQALGQILSGSLRGSGDTRFPMMVTGASIWLVRLPLGWLFAGPLHLGLPGLYLSSVADAAVRALATYLRFRQGGWQHRRV